MQQPTVSLIVPCYNMEKICERFFQSLQEQTFTDIQLILVDDGSKDATAQKIRSFQPALEQLGYQFEYYYQDNTGLGGAINTGLKQVRGEFLCWADPDDYYEKDAFKVRVDYMKEHPECMVLEADAYVRKSSSMDTATRISASFPQSREPKQFELLLNYNSNFCPGCHMVRTEAFRKANPEMNIYPARRGQNWQLLLPVYYIYDRQYLDVPVYDYIEYDTSMSHGLKTYDDFMKRYEENGTIQSETIKRMHISDKEKAKYLHQIDMMTTRLYMYAAMGAHKKPEFRKQYKKLMKNGEITLKDRARFLRLMLLNKG